MTDYPDLYKRLAQEILKTDGKLDGGAQAFIRRLIEKLKAEGWQLQGDAETVLNDYLGGMDAAIKKAIGTAVAVASKLPLTRASLQSEAVLSAAEQAFSAQWPDGLTLTRRLWQWRRQTHTEVAKVLQSGIKQGKAVNSVIYDMQRTIERSTGARFTVVSAHKVEWVNKLADAGRELINNPGDRQQWQKVVADAEAYIDGLAATGTRHDAQRFLADIKTAVEKGRLAAIERAVHWKVYNKQLYNLKRIARTEMANTGHQAVIQSTEHDDSIIGYQWRISGSHKVADICDYYASIEMGLGKGVWTKETVPRHKAHPQCMCLIIPRVTPIRQAGSQSYAEFIDKASPELREQLLPNWVKDAVKSGVPLQQLLRKEGLGLLTRQAAEKAGIIVAMKNDAYDIAKNGGDYDKFYQRYKNEYLPRLNRAVKSYDKVITDHQTWIENPALKLADTTNTDYVRRYTEIKWPQDIARNQTYKTIIEGIIKERKK
ncbi:MAG: hypothetical protein EPN17_00950 [Methylobacter sp.]|nr:MAG: hypothetical protein EPN17_00950 [Methylobacter sp.]